MEKELDKMERIRLLWKGQEGFSSQSCNEKKSKIRRDFRMEEEDQRFLLNNAYRDSFIEQFLKKCR